LDVSGKTSWIIWSVALTPVIVPSLAARRSPLASGCVSLLLRRKHCCGSSQKRTGGSLLNAQIFHLREASQDFFSVPIFAHVRSGIGSQIKKEGMERRLRKGSIFPGRLMDND
jgi:hypothetical protein